MLAPTLQFLRYRSLTAFLFSALAGLSACHGSDPKASVAPTDLAVTATVTSDSSGVVSFQATATNAQFFTYHFGDSDDIRDIVTTADGTATHTYASGNYTVQVDATSADNLTATTTKAVSVIHNPDKGYTTPDHYAGLKLVWQDEFNAEKLNEADWNYETGGSGWGNNELEFYTNNNATVHGGHLTIEARQEESGGRHYTSSRITTQGKQVFQFGRVDIRAKLPKGKGIWPALWMLGSSINTAGWPACGEIDIMEMIGGTGNDNTVHGTAHWDDFGHQSNGGEKSLSGTALLADEYHVYTLIWNATSINWYLDDVLYHTTDITPASASELKAQFFFIFNVAVGGDWPGNPDYTLVFPQQMLVDYIRVFQ